MSRIPKHYAKFDVTMTISRSEMDIMIKLFGKNNDEFSRYVLERIRKAKER